MALRFSREFITFVSKSFFDQGHVHFVDSILKCRFVLFFDKTSITLWAFLDFDLAFTYSNSALSGVSKIDIRLSR